MDFFGQLKMMAGWLLVAAAAASRMMAGTAGTHLATTDMSTEASPPPLIIDTDMSTDVDDVAAVCIANALADRGEATLLAVVHNTGLYEGVGAISVINHYYGRDDVPIGAYKGVCLCLGAESATGGRDMRFL